MDTTQTVEVYKLARYRMTMFNLYFVGGTFGAGKSTICQSLSSLLPGEHLKASELIRYTPDPNDATGKATGHVMDNQDRLVAALDARRSAPGTVILDGHFCLLDDAYSIVRLPVNVFQRIDPCALVLLESTVSEVVDRIKKRDGRKIDPDLIHLLFQAEREHSRAVGEALGVPIMTINGSTAIEAVVAFLRTSARRR